ncbi:MAG: branched-chain amino acid ABC transporter permease [Proteobacteria bacterium]|nr:branched-chain amino acid ABC transporter permease [Pseudomonadota bacterium]
MRHIDKTVVGLTIAFLALLFADFFMAEWMRFIGLQSLARGTVALGLLVLWRTGLVSFGHALYFGFGAYAAAMLTLLGYHDAFFLVFAGTLIAGLLAFLLGFLLRRYRAIFFALLNMAFSMILYGVIVKTEALGSTDGFSVLAPTFLGYAPEGEAVQTTLFLFTLVFTYLITLGVHLYLKTTLGGMSMAVRENEIRVEYLGYSAEKVIHFKYVLSGLVAGFGGAIMALAIGQVDPDSMANWTVSGEFVFITILSGIGNVAATFVGALVFELIRTYAFEYAPQFWQFILGGSLLAIIMFLPDGIWSVLSRLRKAEKAPSP